MKKFGVLFLSAALMTCFLSVPAYASEAGKESRQEIRAEIKEVKEEIKDVNEKLKAEREEKKILSAQVKVMKASKKSGDDLGIDKEGWEKIRSISKDIKEIRTGLKESAQEAKAQRKSAAESIKAKDFDAGLSQLKEVLEDKEERLEKREQINALLEQITEMD